MRLYAPSYYKKFKCIGGECPDNCCIGWQIDVDADTRRKYSLLDGEDGERISESIYEDEDGAHFRLSDGERCPHLNGDNLCNIILRHGEDMLCDICREHPRYYNIMSDLCEVGVGLACPAAAELVLTNEDFEVEPIEPIEREPQIADESVLYVLKAFRWKIFSMLKDAPIYNLIIFICDHSRYTVDFLATELDVGFMERSEISPDCFTSVSHSLYDEVSEGDLERTASVYLSLEMLDEGLRDELRRAFNLSIFESHYYKNATADFTGYLYGDGGVYFRRLLYYYLHRYMLYGAVDGEYDIRIRHAIICAYLTVALSYLRGGDAAAIRSAAIDLSRSIEYSDENLSRIFDEIDKDGYLPPLWVGQMFE